MNIDAVVYWVDGNDIAWQEKINKYAEPKIDFSNVQSSARFNSVGEVYYAIRSIIKFASFVDNIYLVSDNQTPSKFNELQELAKLSDINLEIVDHKVIFRGFEKYLPMFNSTSIETAIYRIPNLSEHFFILNDDYFLIKKCEVEDFFVDGNPVINGSFEISHKYRFARRAFKSLKEVIKGKKDTENRFKSRLQNAAKLVGFEYRFFYRQHAPMCIRKSTLENFFDGNDIFENNIRFRFRDHSQFVCPSLAEHIELKNKTAIISKKNRLSYFGSWNKENLVKYRLKKAELNKNKKFSNFQNIEFASPELQEHLIEWLERIMA